METLLDEQKGSAVGRVAQGLRRLPVRDRRPRRRLPPPRRVLVLPADRRRGRDAREPEGAGGGGLAAPALPLPRRQDARLRDLCELLPARCASTRRLKPRPTGLFAYRRDSLALDDGFLSYSPGSTQVNRHEVFALRFQCLSSVTFEGCLHAVARTSQARLVVPSEPFDATCCKRVFRVLLQLPTRDQVLTTFVYIQNNRQHRRPSVHFHPPSLLVEALPDRRRRIR